MAGTNLPVGSVIYSMLDLGTFRVQVGAGETWNLADGTDLAGQNTMYENLMKNSKLPDLRGLFIRGKNNGRVDGSQNPDGELPVGTFTPDRFKSHNHGGQTTNDTPDHSHSLSGYTQRTDFGSNTASQNLGVGNPNWSMSTGGASARHTHTISQDGGADTAPKSVTMNAFIRIN